VTINDSWACPLPFDANRWLDAFLLAHGVALDRQEPAARSTQAREPSDDDLAHGSLTDAVLQLAAAFVHNHRSRFPPLDELDCMQQACACPAADRVTAALLLLDLMRVLFLERGSRQTDWKDRLDDAVEMLLHGQRAANGAQNLQLARACRDVWRYLELGLPHGGYIGHLIEALKPACAQTEEQRSAVQALIADLPEYRTGEHLWLFERQLRRLGGALAPFDAFDQWAVDADDAFRRLAPDAQVHWLRVFDHARTLGSKPTEKWRRLARAVSAQRDAAAGRHELLAWLQLYARPWRRDATFAQWNKPIGRYVSAPYALSQDRNAALLRGLCHLAALVAPEADTARALADVAAAGYTKLDKGWGARSAMVGAAAVDSLALIANPSAQAQLARLKSEISYAAPRAKIEAHCKRLAEQGIGASDMKQMPDHDPR